MDDSDRSERGKTEEQPQALNAILGANPFVGADSKQAAAAMRMALRGLAMKPEVVAPKILELVLELTRIAAGYSSVAPEQGDRRFADPAWSDHPVYRRLMQTYLAWRKAMHSLAGDNGGGDWKSSEQVRFAVLLLTEALAPTNTLIGNPAALKRAFETGGMSLLRGFRNFLSDLWNNGGMPSQVDKRPFAVGKTIAVTPGAVVHRSELCEVLQYEPATAEVYERPVLLVPPQINKFYIMDLAPGRSLAEYAVARGVPFFTISWRNPGPELRGRGLNEYVAACKEAVEVVCDISRSSNLNLLGVCAGGITSALLLGHMAAGHDHRINSGTLLVTMLDTSMPSMTGMFATEDGVADAVARSRAKGVLDSENMSRLFAWLRPNDLVWNYWVNNYLMGNDPPAFDILFWNSDSTCLPAALHAGFLDLFLRNPLAQADAVEILGTPINLKRVGCDMYILAGQTDHICAWKACYQTTRFFGGRVEFVLNSSGHVQSLVAAPSYSKGKYLTNENLDLDADAWLASATEHTGTWWKHWLAWIGSRAGDKRPAPVKLGNEKFPALEPAPGQYVHVRAK